jgi:hypothetical protein
MYCNHCDNDPCHREVYEQMLRSEGDVLDANFPPNTARRMLYRSYVRAIHGILGHGNRVRVPPCVRGLIRDIFPDPDGAYMGHKDEPAPGGDDDGDDGGDGEEGGDEPEDESASDDDE